MVLEEVGIVVIIAGLALHLVSPIQLLHTRISEKKSSHEHKKRSSHRGLGNDAMSKALQQISKSPFVRRINRAKLPHRFSQPTFAIYNERTDSVEHVSHFNQKMVVHANNEAFR